MQASSSQPPQQHLQLEAESRPSVVLPDMKAMQYALVPAFAATMVQAEFEVDQLALERIPCLGGKSAVEVHLAGWGDLGMLTESGVIVDCYRCQSPGRTHQLGQGG